MLPRLQSQIQIGTRLARATRWLPLLLATGPVLASSLLSAAEPAMAKAVPAPLVAGLKSPVAVTVGGDGRVYVATAGVANKPQSGELLVVDGSTTKPFATGLNDPRAVLAWKDVLFVLDPQQVWKVDKTGKATVFAATTAFPTPPLNLTDLEADETGTLFVSDAGSAGAGAAVYQIDAQGKVTSIADAKKYPSLGTPTALLTDALGQLLVLNDAGAVQSLKIGQQKLVPLAIGWGNGAALTRDWFGRTYSADGATGKVTVAPRGQYQAEVAQGGFKAPADLCLAADGKSILVVDTAAGTVTPVPTGVPSEPINEASLTLEPTVAFPKLQWSGWDAEDDSGKVVPLRPIVLTHAGDGSNRVFVATQHGVIHSFPNDQNAAKTAVLLDIQDRVNYQDKTNEIGLLGFAFHPKFKETGEFFVYYTEKPKSFDLTLQGVDPAKKSGFAQVLKTLFGETEAQATDRLNRLANAKGMPRPLKMGLSEKEALAAKEACEQAGAKVLMNPSVTSVISRFRVSKSDPTKSDPASEEQLMRISQPYWNHNGGTLAFGPDGYLYVALGDGGSGNDPEANGQDLSNILGKLLRIDIDSKSDGKAYGIPKDNPFVGRSDAAPEIYASGFRNPWRIAFDRQTGELWAADVGQNLWEEINLVTKGGNYGWSLREGFHPFMANGTGPREDLTEPIWEYHHNTGKSVTGGTVYRGKQIPDLAGKYVYADYVTGKIWAIGYDAAKKRVTSHQELSTKGQPILSFGEDEQGELYFLIVSPTGQGIYQFNPRQQ